MKHIPNIQFMLVIEKNQYPDNTSKRSHLKGIDAAQEYVNKKSILQKWFRGGEHE